MFTETAKRRQARTRTMSAEARAHYNAYQREYRQLNPDKVRRWRDNYILKKAARLAAEQADRPDVPTRSGGGLDARA